MVRKKFPYSQIKGSPNGRKVPLPMVVPAPLRRAFELRSVELAEERGSNVGLGTVLEDIASKNKDIKRLTRVAIEQLKKEREHATNEGSDTDKA